MTRAGALLRLLSRFLVDVVWSGASTAALIVRGKRTRSGFVDLDYGALGELAASVVAALVTLTPGTSVVDIDPERHRYRLHLLDLEHATTTLAHLERTVLRPAAVLFHEERRP